MSLRKLFRRKNTAVEEPQQSPPIARRSRSREAAFGGEDCEICGTTGTPIVYGLPARDSGLEELSTQGKVVLGGCGVHRGQPTHQCSNCGSQWRIGDS
ncbi:hypothetical protein [Candidatus Lucifugimonas marina]|uniref:Uncharacterized protein n=1 Tax=Candidatus Lucifugimonas marina TaxID=3038979 RepID=A0ABD4XSD0_9CHLR|nr:hypothetical protein [SAR202 cluster bacterium JH702]MDG0870169.1 hypothetical protein [SAR202 cluster bacterium JH639]